jgi:hypothetical protein
MDNALNEDLLYRATKDVLIEVKNEAVDCLKSLHESENIVTNKANGLLQVLFPVFVAIFGYIVIQLPNKKFDTILFIACLQELVIFLSCYFLFDILVSRKTALLGSSPEKMLQERVINKKKEENYIELLRLRVFSLNNAIKVATETNRVRTVLLFKALNFLMIGTSAVIIIFFLTLLV